MGVCASKSLVEPKRSNRIVKPVAPRKAPSSRISEAMLTMAECYGQQSTAELGVTRGHRCVADDEIKHAEAMGISLLYGEILPVGVAKILNEEHLDASRAHTIFDLGMGTGKLLMQAFLQYPNLQRLVGVEFSASRFTLAASAFMTLAELFPDVLHVSFFDDQKALRICSVNHAGPDVLERSFRELYSAYCSDKLRDHFAEHKSMEMETRSFSGQGRNASNASTPVSCAYKGDEISAYRSTTIAAALQARTYFSIELFCGDVWKLPPDVLLSSDITLLHVEVPAAHTSRVMPLIRELKPRSRLLTYHPLTDLDAEGVWKQQFKQREANRAADDTILTSWAYNRGYHLYCWEKLATPAGVCV